MQNALLRRLPSEEERTPTREDIVAHGTEIYEVEQLLDSDISFLASAIAEKSGAYVFYESRVDFRESVIFTLIAVGDQIQQAKARAVAQELSETVADMLRRSRLVQMYNSSHISFGWMQ